MAKATKDKSKTGKAVHCFQWLLGEADTSTVPPVVVCFGDDAFLRRETAKRVLHFSPSTEEDERTFDGEECGWVDVHDELATLSLFDEGGLRVAVVAAADKLLKDSRPAIEKWCSAPASSTLLLLQLSSLPSNTKLYKIVSSGGLAIDCSLPTGSGRGKAVNAAELKRWLVAWAKQEHGLKLSSQQATQILDAVGNDCGLLHQELAKLALYADNQGKLTEEVIRENVGSWRTRTMWEIADSIADGRIPDALAQLDRVFAAGEHPAAVIPQVAWSLRRFGNAANLILQGKRTGQKVSIQAAIGQCGFWGKDAQLAEGRLRRMGLRRASALLTWLLELDLSIKGSHSQPDRARFALETLCLRFR